MKCIWRFKWAIDPFDDDKYMKVDQQFQKALEEHPDDFPTMGPNIITARGVGFRVVEGTYEQMMNLVAIWTPVEEWKLQVYFEGEELT